MIYLDSNKIQPSFIDIKILAHNIREMILRYYEALSLPQLNWWVTLLYRHNARFTLECIRKFSFIGRFWNLALLFLLLSLSLSLSLFCYTLWLCESLGVLERSYGKKAWVNRIFVLKNKINMIQYNLSMNINIRIRDTCFDIEYLNKRIWEIGVIYTYTKWVRFHRDSMNFCWLRLLTS